MEILFIVAWSFPTIAPSVYSNYAEANNAKKTKSIEEELKISAVTFRFSGN